jgi:hypothetical protein
MREGESERHKHTESEGCVGWFVVCADHIACVIIRLFVVCELQTH